MGWGGGHYTPRVLGPRAPLQPARSHFAATSAAHSGTAEEFGSEVRLQSGCEEARGRAAAVCGGASCGRLCRWGVGVRSRRRPCVCVCAKTPTQNFQHAFTPPGVADCAKRGLQKLPFCTEWQKKSSRQGPCPPCFRGLPSGRRLPWLAVQLPPRRRLRRSGSCTHREVPAGTRPNSSRPPRPRSCCSRRG